MRRAPAIAVAAVLLLAVASLARADGEAPRIDIIGAPRTEAIDAIASILTRDLGLSLPARTRVHVYTSREAFRRGIVTDGDLAEDGADELAAFAVGLARPGRVLINARLAEVGTEWQRLLAHELMHVVQFELAGGEGRAEQWLAEGVAEHVAFQVLERLGVGSVARHRSVARTRVPRQVAFAQARLDLATLGSPREFTLRHQREGSLETYHLTFLLADHLIQRDGLGKVMEYFARLRRQPSAKAFAATFGQTLQQFEVEALARLQATTAPAPASP
ncbi:MAG TPA: hypothetical protein VGR82_03435 [Methylomirabilota bacterium]|jgi:hypothetical protein|nr:hypothetical protein [Methylomirabilota bacterium]